MVWLVGFAPTTSAPRMRRSSELSYSQLAGEAGFEPARLLLQRQGALPICPLANGRDGETRTLDVLSPKQAPSPLGHTPLVGLVGIEPTTSGPPDQRPTAGPQSVVGAPGGPRTHYVSGKNRVIVHMTVRRMVPRAGVEPARRDGHGFLKPACLPIPSSGHGGGIGANDVASFFDRS